MQDEQDGKVMMVTLEIVLTKKFSSVKGWATTTTKREAAIAAEDCTATEKEKEKESSSQSK